MNMKLSFIGAGNMAGAIIGGLLKGFCRPQDITVYDISQEALQRWKQRGVGTAQSVSEAVTRGEVIVLAVKPNVVMHVLEEVRQATDLEKKLVLSIAAGVSRSRIAEALNNACHTLRIMPNTPALVGEGMSVIFDNGFSDDIDIACKIMGQVGKTLVMQETYVDAVTAVSGSGPAYFYVALEAMADGGVLCGLPRDTAYTLAAQTMLGAAKMLLETGKHPGALKDQVCSPGGTTIEAVAALEKLGLRSAMIEAVKQCRDKSANM